MLQPRTSGAIALGPTGNEQGEHYFISLHSAKKINRYAWMELPMPNEVIAQVHHLANAAEMYDGIVFTYADGNVLSESVVFKNQLPPETADIEEETESHSGRPKNEDDVTPPEVMTWTTC